ncbi:MAG: AMP phosphorylase [Candidatus Anstonellales archaeon]
MSVDLNHEFKSEQERDKRKLEIWKKKRYFAQAKIIDLYTGKNVVVLNKEDANSHEIFESYRVLVEIKGKSEVVIADLSNELVKRGEIGIFREVAQALGIKEGDVVEVFHVIKPASIEYIKKKIDGAELTENEVKGIISDLMTNRLSEAELASFITAVHIRGMTENESVYLTNAIVESGQTLKLGVEPIADKHCIGGVAGNRTTMVLVPIVAAAGIYIPKSSSRSITSAAGTADTMEVLANVDFNREKLEEIVLSSKGAIVWGGGINIASADDKLIKIRNPLSLDPKGMLLASIMAKKKSVGAKYVVIDLPVGRGAKIDSVEEAHRLANDFISIGKRLGMKVEAVITDGSQPVGNGIGPALECIDVLEVLEGRGPEDLKTKSCLLAGKIIEMVGKVEEGKGYSYALKLLETGKAMEKMREIIKLQGGNPNIKAEDIKIGRYSYQVKSKKAGKISHIDNKRVNKLARAAGAPFDKGAGIYLHRSVGEKVEEGDVLFTIYAESEDKLDFAVSGLEVWFPMELQKIILQTLK